MVRNLQRAIKTQRGQALPIVLILMSFGGLLIVPSLNYTSTMLKATRVTEKNTNGFYSADAGIEHGLYTLKNSEPATFPYAYDMPALNGLSTNVLIERLTTLYGIVVGNSGEHADYLETSGTLAFNTQLGVYVYTVTIGNKSTSTVHIDKILVKLPDNFVYVTGTTSGNFTTMNPAIKGDIETGYTLAWNFSPPLPSIPKAPAVRTQTFHLNGPGGYSGPSGNVWVVANRTDIGLASTTDAFCITATTRQDAVIVATIKAGVLRDTNTGEVSIIYFEQYPAGP